MRGSLLITFYDEDGKGGDYIDISINTVLVKRIYNSSNNLYTCPLLIGDVVNIRFEKGPVFFGSDYGVIRRDYTTDDVDGDMGIKETNITTGVDLNEITFTATTISSAYDFNYILDLSLAACVPIGNVTYSGGTGTFGDVSTSEIKSNGDIYIGSTTNKTTINYSGTTGSSEVGNVFKVNDRYQLLTDFNSTSVFSDNFGVNDIELQSDGKIIVAGSPITPLLIETTSYCLYRLLETGDLDPTFNLNEFYGIPYQTVTDAVLQSDGKIIVTGDFSKINNLPYKGYARFNSNGTIDNTYYSGGTSNGFNNVVNCEIDNSTNKTYFFGTGDFRNSYFGSILRLNTDGTLDTTFNGTGLGGFNRVGSLGALVNSITILSSGKILCLGLFNQYNGVSIPQNIARLNQDGSLDTSFNSGGTGLTDIALFFAKPTETLNEYENSYLIVFGEYTGFYPIYNGQIIPDGLFFLNEDGTLGDNTNIGTGLEGEPKTCKKLPNGGYLITGAITSYNGTSITNGGIVQITNTGVLQNC